MTIEELTTAVREMRDAQNKYIKSRRWDDLDDARKKAARVDRMLKEDQDQLKLF